MALLRRTVLNVPLKTKQILVRNIHLPFRKLNSARGGILCIPTDWSRVKSSHQNHCIIDDVRVKNSNDFDCSILLDSSPFKCVESSLSTYYIILDI